MRARCPGEHRYVQHGDGKPQWCEACGLTNSACPAASTKLKTLGDQQPVRPAEDGYGGSGDCVAPDHLSLRVRPTPLSRRAD
jgi:hypothetical protein